ncbi:MAG: hypothetical protein PQJ49_13600, partial [Sphaerochaetaceae bacterium]|nr:hypothetical protein [Sphaerochaetaceae bacterium]
MEGWKLKEGTISFKQIDDFEVMSLIFRALGPSSARTTSYKFCFFKSLLDNLFNADNRNLSIPFRNIFTTFTSIYYNLIVKWDLFQMSSKNNTVCSIRKIIENFVVEYPQLNGTFIPFESLKSSLQIELINRVQREGMKYVIGAFYGDTNGQIFNFSKKERIVWLNPSAYKTLVRQKNMF